MSAAVTKCNRVPAKQGSTRKTADQSSQDFNRSCPMEVAAMEIAPINRPTAHLMTSRRFAPLFWTQFLSAFNDNFLKNTLVFLILFTLAADKAASLVTLAGAVFMLPFLLLSALGGEIADRYDKALIARRLKFTEIAAAAVAVVGI